MKSTPASRAAESIAAQTKADRLIEYVLARLALYPPLRPAVGPGDWDALLDFKPDYPCEATRPHLPQGTE